MADQQQKREVTEIRNFAHFCAAARSIHGFAEQFLVQNARFETTNDNSQSELDRLGQLMLTRLLKQTQQLYHKALGGDLQSFGLLLLLANHVTNKINHAARSRPDLAQHYSKQLFLWPGIFSYETGLNDRMVKIL